MGFDEGDRSRRLALEYRVFEGRLEVRSKQGRKCLSLGEEDKIELDLKNRRGFKSVNLRYNGTFQTLYEIIQGDSYLKENAGQCGTWTGMGEEPIFSLKVLFLEQLRNAGADLRGLDWVEEFARKAGIE